MVRFMFNFKSGKHKFIFLSALFLIVAVLGAAFTIITKPHEDTKIIQAQEKTFTMKDLKEHDGTDPNKPIYLTMNGLVYDVTAGKKFYEPGGTYHFLTGTDDSAELNSIGGDIIKREYPVIEKLVE